MAVTSGGKIMGWIFVVLAGIFEVGFTTCLKLSEGFTRLVPSLGFLLFALISFFLLMTSIQILSLGTAYAVWVGIGAFGTALVGMMFFDDPVTLPRVFFLGMLVISVIGLKFVS